MAKLMSPLGLIFERTTQRILEQDMPDLRQHIEQPGADIGRRFAVSRSAGR